MRESNKTNKDDRGIISKIDFPYETEIQDTDKTTDSKVFKIQTSMGEAKKDNRWSFLNILEHKTEAEKVYSILNLNPKSTVGNIIEKYLELSDEIKNLKTEYLGEYKTLKKTEDDAANQTRTKMYIQLGNAIGPYIKEKYEEDLIKQSDTIFKLYYMYYALFYGNDDLVKQLKFLKNNDNNISDFDLLKNIGKEIEDYIKEEYNSLQENENFMRTFRRTNRDKKLKMIKEVKEKNISFEKIINGFNNTSFPSTYTTFLIQFTNKKLGNALFYIIFNDTLDTKLSDIANADLEQNFTIEPMKPNIARAGAFNHYFGHETNTGKLQNLLKSNIGDVVQKEQNREYVGDKQYYIPYFTNIKNVKGKLTPNLENITYNDGLKIKISNYPNIETTSMYIFTLYKIVGSNQRSAIDNTKKIPIFIEHIKHLLTEMSKSDFDENSLTKLGKTIVGKNKTVAATNYTLYGNDFNSVIKKFDMFIQEMESATKSKSESISLPINFKTYFDIGKYKQKSIKPKKPFKLNATLSNRIIELAKPKRRGGNRITRRKKKRKNLVVPANISIKK